MKSTYGFLQCQRSYHGYISKYYFCNKNFYFHFNLILPSLTDIILFSIYERNNHYFKNSNKRSVFCM